MEKWQKDEVLTALDKATIDYAKIKFCDVARSLGYKYINTIDVITPVSYTHLSGRCYHGIGQRETD